MALGGEWVAPDLAGHGTAARLSEYTFGAMAEGVAEGLADFIARREEALPNSVS